MPGERREILEYQRARLLEALGGEVEKKDLPALSRELRLVLAELDGLGGSEEGSVVDELRERRAARLAGPEAETGSST